MNIFLLFSFISLFYSAQLHSAQPVATSSSSSSSSSSQPLCLMTEKEVQKRIQLNRDLLRTAVSDCRFDHINEMSFEERQLEVKNWYVNRFDYLITYQRAYDAIRDILRNEHCSRLETELNKQFFRDEFEMFVKQKTGKQFAYINQDSKYLELQQRYLDTQLSDAALVASRIRSLENSLREQLISSLTEPSHIVKLCGEELSDNYRESKEKESKKDANTYPLWCYEQLLHELDERLYASNPSKELLKERSALLNNHENQIVAQKENIMDNEDINFASVPEFYTLAQAEAFVEMRKKDCDSAIFNLGK